MKNLFLVFALLAGQLVFPGGAEARCSGIDYRTRLAPEQKARLDREIRKTPFAHGNHWIATRGARRIHIIGTMHAGDSRMGRVMRTLRPVLAQADAILFEISGHDLGKGENTIIDNAGHFLLPRGRSLKQITSPQLWDGLSRIAVARGFNPENLDRLQPWAASMLLLGKSCRLTGFGIRHGLDDRIERFAIRKRIPIGSLETGDESFSALSGVSLRNQVRSLEFEMQMEIAARPDDATGVEAYFDEAVWEAMVLYRGSLHRYIRAPRREIDQHWARFENNLLIRRNRLWVPRILATEGDTLVVAVGAAHLPGHAGVLNLLKAKGYALERGPW